MAKAIGGAKQSLIGSYRNPADGRRIVTYRGWPLYKYVLDKRPREADGQNVALSGGFWWVLTPAGKVNQTAVPHGGYDEGS
jgi:predicted lipoprotein with Yx(FWY)xxD motif